MREEVTKRARTLFPDGDVEVVGRYVERDLVCDEAIVEVRVDDQIFLTRAGMTMVEAFVLVYNKLSELIESR
jgi:hypothetical protein